MKRLVENKCHSRCFNSVSSTPDSKVSRIGHHYTTNNRRVGGKKQHFNNVCAFFLHFIFLSFQTQNNKAMSQSKVVEAGAGKDKERVA